MNIIRAKWRIIFLFSIYFFLFLQIGCDQKDPNKNSLKIQENPLVKVDESQDVWYIPPFDFFATNDLVYIVHQDRLTIYDKFNGDLKDIILLDSIIPNIPCTELIMPNYDWDFLHDTLQEFKTQSVPAASFKKIEIINDEIFIVISIACRIKHNGIVGIVQLPVIKQLAKNSYQTLNNIYLNQKLKNDLSALPGLCFTVHDKFLYTCSMGLPLTDTTPSLLMFELDINKSSNVEYFPSMPVDTNAFRDGSFYIMGDFDRKGDSLFYTNGKKVYSLFNNEVYIIHETTDPEIYFTSISYLGDQNILAFIELNKNKNEYQLYFYDRSYSYLGSIKIDLPKYSWIKYEINENEIFFLLQQGDHYFYKSYTIN